MYVFNLVQALRWLNNTRVNNLQYYENFCKYTLLEMCEIYCKINLILYHVNILFLIIYIFVYDNIFQVKEFTKQKM